MCGLTELDLTHVVAQKRGVWFCTLCGAYATVAPRDLGKPCRVRAKGLQPTTGGRAALNRIQRDLPPKSNINWPR